MCFSPEVDLVVGTAIAVVAVDAIRNCPSQRAIPLALMPMAFALHTFESALVWCGFNNWVPAWLSDAAEYGYLMFAFAILPLYVPLAIGLIEPVIWRRRLLWLVEFIGIVGGGAYAIALLNGHGQATACNLYIDFDIANASPIAGLAYPIATVGAALLSSYRPISIWGISNVFVTAFLVFWNQHGLASLWCFYAAATSVFIALFLRQLPREPNASGLGWHLPK